MSPQKTQHAVWSWVGSLSLKFKEWSSWRATSESKAPALGGVTWHRVPSFLLAAPFDLGMEDIGHNECPFSFTFVGSSWYVGMGKACNTQKLAWPWHPSGCWLLAPLNLPIWNPSCISEGTQLEKEKMSFQIQASVGHRRQFLLVSEILLSVNSSLNSRGRRRHQGRNSGKAARPQAPGWCFRGVQLTLRTPYRHCPKLQGLIFWNWTQGTCQQMP